jgi:hypothetical protein
MNEPLTQPNRPQISHLHFKFAYDLKIFSIAKNSEALSILSCLEKYSNWYGQKANFTKLALFFFEQAPEPSLQKRNPKGITSRPKPQSKYRSIEAEITARRLQQCP